MRANDGPSAEIATILNYNPRRSLRLRPALLQLLDRPLDAKHNQAVVNHLYLGANSGPCIDVPHNQNSGGGIWSCST